MLVYIGAPITLADCIQRNLIDSETGKIFESKLKQLNIAVPNQFMSSRSARNAPINFEDALKVPSTKLLYNYINAFVVRSCVLMNMLL